MDSTRTPRQSGRRTSPSRPRSRVYRKKQSLVKRVASTLRRRRSQLNFIYQNAIIEMAESKLNLPHEGQPGLICAVSEIPNGHSRQSLIDVFDDVVANMSASTTKSSSQRSWVTYQTSREDQSKHSTDLLTGSYDHPDDFNHYLAWRPLQPLLAQSSSKVDGASQEPSELAGSPPRTPSKVNNECLIDLDTPPSTDPPTPQDTKSSYIDELFLGGPLKGSTSQIPVSCQSPASLDALRFPRPLDFKESPYPVLTPQLTTSTPVTPKRLHRRSVYKNLKLDTQSSALQTPQADHQATRKAVAETPTRRAVPQHQRYPTLQPPTPVSYRPYRPAQPSPTLPPVLTRATDSLLDEMNSEIERVMQTFSPTPPKSTERPRKAPSTFPLPPTHRIPTRSTSRTPNTTLTTPPTALPPPASTNLHAASSFRSRLGASTLTAILYAAVVAADDPHAGSPTAAASAGEPYSWHRWVDCARDEDSEAEERELRRRWREGRRRRIAEGQSDGQREEEGM